MMRTDFGKLFFPFFKWASPVVCVGVGINMISLVIIFAVEMLGDNV